MKKRIIIASIFILTLGLIVIINIPKSDSKPTEPNTTTITTISETTTKTSTTTKTTTRTTKKHTKKQVKVKDTEITSYLYERVLANGWNNEDYNAIVNIVIKESGFNPNSVNKTSGACGLFQAHPCNKAIKQYPDYMTNYKSQVDWGLKYIKERYKTPSNAWKFWQEHKWY